jgi:hypothetical protein
MRGGDKMDEDKTIDKELELTDEMIARNDEIDNAVFNCVNILLDDEIEWNMEIIGDVTGMIKDYLWERHKLRVRHPGVVTNVDGSQFYCDYGLHEAQCPDCRTKICDKRD